MLSGGQRQRLSIARALMTRAPILILDEPTSSFNFEHEHVITETLRRIKGQRTIILVSHRLSSVIQSDEILFMHRGRIIERGSHESLMKAQGRYYTMAKYQLGLGELAKNEPAELPNSKEVVYTTAEPFPPEIAEPARG